MKWIVKYLFLTFSFDREYNGQYQEIISDFILVFWGLHILCLPLPRILPQMN